MLFRECRLLTLNEIFKINDPDITIEKTFLAIEGIKAGIYLVRFKGIEFIVPAGCGEINLPELCKRFELNYSKEEVSDFINQFISNKDYREKYVYIIPCASTVLNTDYVEDISHLMVGQSMLMVDYIDQVNQRVYMRMSNDIEKEYWMNLEILKNMSDIECWGENEPIKVYKISIKEIQNNKHISELLKTDSMILFKKVVNQYQEDRTIEFYDRTSRIEGPSSYLFIINHFNRLLKLLEKEEDQTKRNQLIRYIRIQVKYFRDFLISGADGYYRDEFEAIINELFKLVDIDDFEEIKHEWRRISNKWRSIGRKLSVLLKQDNIPNGVEQFISQLENISKLELQAINYLNAAIGHIN
ncbi:hypothetical protein [Cellulosilyticum ruminicola]|uniref:hypothetical protein n=1 Tax=Cellulosilyticum ruminicola TaxID=425254 RepID=UPI0006D12408|nr:hypothetical protein [Cellulosilyticum ruminicola]